jgi:hypothetical protein
MRLPWPQNGLIPLKQVPLLRNSSINTIHRSEFHLSLSGFRSGG